MATFMHRLIDAMFGPLVPDDHPWAALSRLDVADGQR